MSMRGMTSVRTCYCKHERNVPCEKDNHVGAHEEKRHPASVAPKNEACRSNEEPRKMRSIVDEKLPSDPILSPETSTVLENAEKIIDDAKIQLVEICGMSRPDSARRNVNTYSDDPPLDDEAEELLYIRQLVACKFDELSSSRCEDASGKASSTELVRRVDLSAPKFRMPQRRQRDDWSSLKHGRDMDDRESQERALLTEAPSKDEDETRTTTTTTRTRNDRARDRRRASSSSPAECELVRARGNACRIQMGPSLHIVHRELSKQDLEDVHISPEPSRLRSRANTATYALRHDIVGSSKSTSADNEAEMSRTPRTVVRARLNPLQKEKRGMLMIDPSAEQAETIASSQVSRKRVGEIGDFDSGRADGERIESSKSHIHEARNEAEETGLLAKYLEPARPMMNQAAANYFVTADAGNEKSKRDKKENENQAEVTVRDDTGRYCACAEESGGTSNKRSDIDKQPARPRDVGGGSAADEIREEKQSDRSKPPAFLAGDAPRKTGCLRRENITSSRYRATENTRAIDECFSNTYDSHSEQTTVLLRDVAGENLRRRRSIIPRFSASDLGEVDLYQPRLDDLDSILLSNEEMLERVTRAASDFAELLSRPEFLKYRLENDEKQITTRREHSEEFYREPIRSSTTETELKNVDLTISRSSDTRRVDASLHKVFGHTTETTKSSKRIDDNDSQNSVECLRVYPTLVASEAIGRSSSRDEARRVKIETHSSDTSMNKSDVTTSLSDVLPALSSTRATEIRTCRRSRDEQILPNDRRADRESRAAVTNRSLRRDVDRFPERLERSDDDVLSQVFRGLKDATGSTYADRVVTYILQDEKQSLEGKIASALKGSAITPRAVQKLLDRLREMESIRSTQRTETLSILKDILISIKSETEEDAENAKKLDKEVSSRQLPRLSDKLVRANRTTSNEIAKFSSRQKTIDTSDEIARNSQDLTPHDSSNVSNVNREDVRGSVRSETRSEATAGPKNDNESKGDAECSEPESLKQIPDIRSDDDEDPGRNSGQLSTKITSARSNKSRTDDADRNKSPANQDTTEDIMQPTEITYFVDSRSTISAEASVAAKEITIDETRDNIATMIKSESPILSAMLKMKEPSQSDASFSAKFLVGKVLKEKSIPFVHSSAREDDGSPRAMKIDMNLQQPAEKTTKEELSPAKSCSLDSRRNCTPLSSVKNSKSSLKEIASPEQISFNIKGDDNSTRSTRNENGGEPTRIEIENGGFDLLKRDDNEQRLINKMNSLRENKTDITSKVVGSSSSSVSSTLLDHDERYINGLSGARVKGIETSSETWSHSEGELYMPSSCSYSLGEVRMLRKCDLIADSATDRRDSSSVTLLVTKSMLTSLNDSTTSSVENSGRV